MLVSRSQTVDLLLMPDIIFCGFAITSTLLNGGWKSPPRAYNLQSAICASLDRSVSRPGFASAVRSKTFGGISLTDRENSVRMIAHPFDAQSALSRLQIYHLTRAILSPCRL